MRSPAVMFRSQHIGMLLLAIAICTTVLFIILPHQTLISSSDDDNERIKFLQKIPNLKDYGGESRPIVNDDVHVRKIERINRRRTHVAPRIAMQPCPAVFGKVVVFVAVVTSSYQRFYKVAQDSLKCYLKSTNYTFLLIDMDTDERVNRECGHSQLFFKKHCAASAYLRDTDWMLVLDADTGVVNPNHCIEEWIDDRVDLIFYERFFNWEIASGNYLVRNTPFAAKFLKKWADWQYEQPSNWNGADNGVLQIHVLQTVLPDARQEIKICDRIWHKGTGYDTYMAYVTCVKVTLGANRMWPGKLRILRRAHGWVRDAYLTADRWSQHDFMYHGWKHNQTEYQGWMSPFKKMFNISECGVGEAGWHWREEYRVNADHIRKSLSDFEIGAGRNFPQLARIHPYLIEGDIGECWPHCDDET